MQTQAIVIKKPQQLALEPLTLLPPGDDDVVVDVAWSGISTGTERLLWNGRMPTFPGMGYPLVPGYEAVGHVRSAGPSSGRHAGDTVFVPGARCFENARGLFGASAQTLVVAGAKTYPLAVNLDADAEVAADSALLALAATAYHALHPHGPDTAAELPELIIGHGVLGRLLARLSVALSDAAPTVWERDAARADGADGYVVIEPQHDNRADYRRIVDVSGDAALLDTLIGRLAHGGEIVLAGFYSAPLSFTFPPAFMREARLRIAAEWRPGDLDAVIALTRDKRLSLSGLISHREPAAKAADAYRTAFNDPNCVKMILDWSDCS